MILLASGPEFFDKPLAWYLYHIDIATTPRYVEWGRAENLTFLSVHAWCAALIGALTVWRALAFYVARRHRVTRVQRYCLIGGLLVSSAVAHLAILDRGGVILCECVRSESTDAAWRLSRSGVCRSGRIHERGINYVA
jgi:hypothetical protein